MNHLVVVRPFGKYRIGEVITEPDDIAKVLSSEHGDHVVRITPQSEA